VVSLTESQGNRLGNQKLHCRWVCGYVCRGRQGEMKRIHPPPTSSKTRWKSFCEVDHTKFWKFSDMILHACSCSLLFMTSSINIMLYVCKQGVLLINTSVN